MIRRLWLSPTATSYASFIARSLGMLILLPLVLTRLEVEAINLWYLFASISAFQLVFELGFVPTFSRTISYAMGGVRVDQLTRPEGAGSGSPDMDALRRVCGTMGYVFSRLGLAWLLVLLVIGSAAVFGPISELDESVGAWLAWIIVVAGATSSFFGSAYVAFLLGINEVALVRRWEVIFAVGSTVSCVIVIMLSSSLLFLVLAQQAWLVAGVLRNLWLSGRALDGNISLYLNRSKCPQVLSAIWPGTWRTGLGAASSIGLIQASAVIYAQLASPAEAVSYFLALRLIQFVNVFSQAPFYSKLPAMARHYASGEAIAVIGLARRGMRLSYASFVVAFVGLEWMGAPLLEYLGSNADFPGPALWHLMGFAFFVERFGAMHINLYAVTHRIINHVANGVAGVLQILIAVVMFPLLGSLAFPLALLLGYLFFYAPYAVVHSYSEFKLRFFQFEASVMFPALLVLVLYSIQVNLVS